MTLFFRHSNSINEIGNLVKKVLVIKLCPCLLILMTLETANAGTIGFWKFEEGSLDTVASGANSILDSSGNNLHMNPFSGPTYRAVSNPGSTLGLEVSSDYVYRADSALFQLNSLTIEAFIKYDGGGGSLTQIFFRGDSRGGVDPYYLAINDGKLRFNISDLSVDRSLIAPDLLPVGEFVHVAATLNDSTDLMKIFVNGTEVASQSAAGIRPDDALFASAQVSIGALYDGFGRGQYFDGMIDEVRLSNMALTPDQFLNAPAVPEPSTFALLGIGGITLVGYGFRRKRRQAA